MGLVAPPGWPAEVRPPDAPDWERTAVNWMLDLCPPDYRAYPALRRHVVVLARFAVLHIEAQQAACRRGLGEARAELREVADPDVVANLSLLLLHASEAPATPSLTNLARAILRRSKG